MTVPRSRWLDFAPVLALLLTVAGTLWASSATLSKLTTGGIEIARRVEKLEELTEPRDERSRMIDLRLARIEVKLEMIAERPRDRPRDQATEEERR